MSESVSSIARIYAVSDLHGHLSCLLAVLEKISLDDDQTAELVLLGDYIDRGPSSRQVLETVRTLQQRLPARVTALLGNHEEWFLDWLDSDDEDCSWLMGDRGLTTVKSFLEPLELAHALGHDDPDSDASELDGPTTNSRVKKAVQTRHAELIEWLRRLPRVYETDHQIFVHAGVDEDAGEEWRLATPDHVFTEKYPPTFGHFLKTVVAGHVATSEMHEDGSHGVYYDGESHFYIDGSVEHTGEVSVLRYEVRTGRYEFVTVGADEKNGSHTRTERRT